MKLTADYWIKYINTHTSANKAAERRMERYIAVHGIEDMDKLADYAYSLVSRYGEAASALSCEMYDQLARAQHINVPEAIPAETASYSEVASAVRGAGKRSPSLIPDAVGRLVKQAGADTTLQNAKRDDAYFAWVAHGDTCPYCLVLSGLGWQKAGELTLKGGHAEHIHANCDCEYAVDLKGDLEIDGYDPYEINQQIREMTDDEFDAEDLIRMSGRSAKGHDHSGLNSIRRKQYAADPEKYRAQNRKAYALRQERRLKEDEGIFYTLDGRGTGKQYDIIKPRNIYKDLRRSKTGKEALKLVEDNGYDVRLCYGADSLDKNGIRRKGVIDHRDKLITIFVDETKSISDTAATFVHEANHLNDFGYNRKSEAYCELKAEMHRKRVDKLTLSDVKRIIKKTDKDYSDYSWR